MRVQNFKLFDSNSKQNEIMKNLNVYQKEAVISTDGPHLVLAGPGTGKTTVITYKTIFLIKEKNVNPEKLLILTFTNKAAEEMQKRIKKYINSTIPYIGTFHSVIIKLLKQIMPIRTTMYHLEDKINIIDEEDKIEVIKNILSNRKTKKKITPYILSNIISCVKNKKDIPLSPETQELIEEYNFFLKKINSLDFDDIILCINNILLERRDIKQRISSMFEYIIVDEYQDINQTQFEFLLHLTESNRNIFVVGDDDQSIYSFRNAEVQIMLDFPKYYLNPKIINLEYNYRSASEIIKTYSRLISYNINRFPKNIKPIKDITGSVDIKIFREEEKEYEYICQNILSNKNKSIAILCRTNDICKEFEKNIIKRGINAKFVSGYDFFERKEIKNLISFLKIINNPKDDISFIRVLKNYFRLKNSEIKKITKQIEEKNVIDILEQERYDIYKEVQEMIEKSDQPVIEILDEIMLKYEKNQDSNLLKIFAQFVENFCKNNEKNDVENFLNYITLIRMNREHKIETKDRVLIMTMHSSKGLEFDVVFVCSVKQGVIPHFKTHEKEKEEERRLLYVAMSRAREKLFITTTTPPSEFILPLLK
ncbi:MAG: 3'-5' exonuclease [Candidatus Calescibacterium sp.]|nr:UvrD-helicase domain-containing protein [Candidatus Calescibacterium sp.]MCX7758393.1 UvrD-helicase domain-containing protein [bacterium]MDW8195887.1 3'-5' exonuclease [Candidatus Calescibacterium sp.]